MTNLLTFSFTTQNKHKKKIKKKQLDITALRVYIWLALIYGVITLIFAIISFVSGAWLVYAILNIIVSALNVYFPLVVNSYAGQLEEQSLPGN